MPGSLALGSPVREAGLPEGFWTRGNLLISPLVSAYFAGTTCSTPTSIEHANIRVKSYNENSRERYVCNSGFKRKAGTSSLTKCLRNEDTNVTEWTIPSLKCVKPAATSKSDAAETTTQAAGAGAGPAPAEPPSAGSTGSAKREPSRAPPRTPAGAGEHTHPPSLDEPGVHSYRWTGVMVTVPILFAVLCGAAIVALCRAARCRPWRQTSWTPSVEMENVEDAPMTGGADGGEDTENHHAV
ncbi:interleukin-15 receptor subunit alpha isoform X2 [Rousettus aegyptiacus]|uniref:interleukin-15 receptor subunit alpha isoform X2 n=1 Tax=Rousettus aegyptiacus TaxID=9407 RepID=UPI00168D52FF|nr:interleukin-15 receptor subunit alpha isoform X2 [Rousettus aegyptiacus]